MIPLHRLPCLFSLRTVILLGFALGVAPLAATLVSAVRAVDELAALAQTVAWQVAQLSQRGENLRERLVDFERKAKHHLVLADADSRRELDAAFRHFAATASELEGLLADPDVKVQAASLGREGAELYARLSARPVRPVNEPRRLAGPRPLSLARADGLFATLGSRMRGLVQAVSAVTESEVRTLEIRSESVKQRLLRRIWLWLPVSLGLIALVVFVTIRSVRQMESAIRRLGGGDWTRPIRVAGPRDMEYLGERLDWLRSRLLVLEEARQQFLRQLSHELKTPLASIHEGTALLADEVVGELNTEQRDIAKIMLGGTLKLETLIEELINYSQVGVRPIPERLARVDLAPLVESVLAENQLRLKAKHLRVAARLQAVRIDGHREQLRTLIDNLLSNAIKYSPSEGEIALTLALRGQIMELDVEDDGPGIAEDERQQVFEPFFQGRAAREEGVGGTGLGLSIVSECVAVHHGKAEVLDPRPPRIGAHIRVSIPCRLSA